MVPHAEPGTDDFNFWFWQMPLIYYPEISFQNSSLPGTVADYYHVGYRTLASTTFTDTELFKTNNTKVNLCDNLNFAPVHTSPTLNLLQPSSGFIPSNHVPILLVPFALAHNESICDLFIGIDENEVEQFISITNNPPQDEIKIDIETTLNNPVSISLIDLSGKNIETQMYSSISVGSALSFKTRQLSKGLYILRVTYQDQTMSQKVVIQ